ncbi:DUF4867 family protein [Pediococcus siamensis]|uniref:DUF4867 family protein n=1 Tax=Pediococcus siamensis TaxID=381829 RepID=UPI0039A38F4E
MSKLDEIRKANPDKTIYDVNSEAFADFGLVYKQYDLSKVTAYMDSHIEIPTDHNDYVPDDETLEKDATIQQIAADVYAGMPISAGPCVGQSTSFSAIEFHQGSEVNIAFTDVVMVLGKRRDIHDYEYDAETHAKLFFVPAGTVFEMYSDTLHYSPCKVDESGFKVIVMVLQGTNQPLPAGFKATNKMIVKQNKFQMAHASRTDKIAQGILPGVKGKLIDIKPIQN